MEYIFKHPSADQHQAPLFDTYFWQFIHQFMWAGPGLGDINKEINLVKGLFEALRFKLV